ncbi:MAG: hypothetical protein IT209_08855 [Armatimonadetes bacterium]|nr:hypothetical protein [Armatimonadota bacterium]
MRKTTMANDATVEELKALLDSGADLELLDVREVFECEIATIGGRNIPLGELPGRVGELDPARPTIVQCKSGGRSAEGVKILQRAGFENVRNLAGGIDAWSDRIDSSVPKYQL